MATATDSNKKNMTFNEEQQLHKEAETMRLIAFFSIFVAAIACLVGIVAVPMLYGYLQRVQSVLEVEADYCKSATGTLWQQFARTQIIKGVAPSQPSLASSASLEEATKRGKRQTGYGGDAAASGAAPSASSPSNSSGMVSSAPLHVADKPTTQPTCGCSCGIGMAGPPGEPGPDGEPGKDGQAGPAGDNGADVAPNEHPKPKEFCFECEPSAPGPAGEAGVKGSPGSPGPNGQPGAPGKSSGPGEPGPPGPPGQAGAPGSNGQPGAAGQVKEVDVPAGPPGPPGQPGPDGTPGTPGQSGKPGSDGAPGPAGDDGQPGKPGKAGENGDQGPAGVKGDEGACDHCPPPRSAPGY